MKTTWLMIALVTGCLSVAAAFDKAGDALTSARQKLQKKDYAGAREDAAAADALAQTPGDKINIAILRGQIAEGTGDTAGARTEYERVIADPQAANGQKIDVFSRIANTWITDKKYDKALTAYASVLALPGLAPQIQANIQNAIGRVFERQENWAAARAEYNKCVVLEKVPETSKFTALCAIAGTFQKEKNLPEMKKAVDAILAAKGGVVAKAAALRDYALLAAAKNEPTQALVGWQQIIDLPEVPAKSCTEAVARALDILATQGRNDDASKFAERTAGSSQVSIGDRLYCRLVVCGVNAAGKEDGLKGDVQRVLGTFPKSDLTAEIQVAALRNAGKFFMTTRQYPVVRAFTALIDAMYRQEPQPIYHCRFSDKAPSSVEGWLASPLMADPKNRESHFEEYDRKAAALLINDVNVERSVTEAGLAADKKTSFMMTYDDDGWRIFVECEDAQAEKVFTGLLGGGQLEMFFAPGLGAGYYQWFVSFPKPDFKSVSWDCPNRHFREMDSYCAADTGVVPGGFGASIFIPWELVYDKLPADGDTWPFNVIRWTRAGGVTWRGKVHAIHDYGKVEWEGLTTERLLAIKRKLVMKGLSRYQKSRRDIVAFWKDEVLGDPVFFQQVLLPVVEKLDAAGKKVDVKMPVTDIESLFADAVPDWMEFNYKVAELRRDYLAAKLFQEAQATR